jgi:hypothetical protein
LFFLAALLAAATAVALPFTVTVDNRFEVLNAADTLARTGTLGDPFSQGPTGPTAHVAPVFPALAALLHFLPFDWTKSLAVLAILLCGLNAAAMPYAALSLWGDFRPGILAGILSAVSLRIMPQQDVALSALLAIVACCAMTRGSKLAAGIFAGLAVLSNPASVLAFLAWLIFLPDRKMWRTVLVGIALICTPWVIRNWVQLGSPAPVRDNFGLELDVSNNDCAELTMIDNPGCFVRRHPSYSLEENHRVRNMGEIPYNKAKMATAVSWILHNPGRTAALAVRRARRYFFPGPWLDGPSALGISLTTAIALAGLLLGLVKAWSVLPVAAVLSWLPYIFIQVDTRYRSLSLWIWFLLAGYAVQAFWVRVRERRVNS